MLQNITLRAEKELIERARQQARSHNTTLNSEFQRWLAQYAGGSKTATDLNDLMAQFKYVNPGKSFNRDELNES
jgi:hypothetical protein